MSNKLVHMPRGRKAAAVLGNRVIIYARVSSEKQADEISLDAQVARCRDYARAFDLQVVRVIQEVGSAKSLSGRPQLEAALKDVAAKRADGVLIAKLDRLTRSLRDLLALVDPGGPGQPAGVLAASRARLLSVSEQIDTSSATGRMMVSLIGIFAQWERERISERTAEAMHFMRERNQYVGGYVPYGWRREGDQLVHDEREQRLLAHVRKMMKPAGAKELSLRAIGKQLQVDGWLSRTGKPFGAASVRKLIAAAGA